MMITIILVMNISTHKKTTRKAGGPRDSEGQVVRLALPGKAAIAPAHAPHVSIFIQNA
jgi:hypothetical protein